MTTLQRLLKAAQTATDPATVQGVADRLGVARQTVYTWKRGDLEIADEYLAKLIEIAGADPSDAIAVRQESAKSARERSMWNSVAKRLGIAAAIALCVVGTGENALVSSAFAASGYLPMHIMSTGAAALAGLAWWMLRTRSTA